MGLHHLTPTAHTVALDADEQADIAREDYEAELRDYRLAEMELWSVAAKRAARIADRVHPPRRINASGWEGAAMLFDPARHSYRRDHKALFNRVRERMIAKLTARGFIEQSMLRLNAEIEAIRLRERSGMSLADFMPAERSVPELCGDCPPVGYVTDITRCLPCPRRSAAPDFMPGMDQRSAFGMTWL